MLLLPIRTKAVCLFLVVSYSLELGVAQDLKTKKGLGVGGGGGAKGGRKRAKYTAEEKELNCVNQPKGTDYCGESIRECVDGRDDGVNGSLCPKALNKQAESEIICKRVPGKTASACFCPDKLRFLYDDGSSDHVCSDLKAKRTKTKPTLLTDVERKMKCVSQPKGTDYCGMSIDECVNGFEEIPGDDEILCPKARYDEKKQKEIICKTIPGVEDEKACFCPDKYRMEGSDGASDRVCEDLLAGGRKR